MQRTKIIAMCAIATLAMRCSGKNPKVAEIPTPEAPPSAVRPSAPPTPPAPSGPVELSPMELSEEEWFASATIEQLQARLSDVYFDYDHANLRSDAQAVIDKNRQWLTRPYNTVVVEIEGHCDERGTTGYNLALGEQRSRSVVSYLLALGLPPERLRFVSYGKERPVCTDAMENCWWRNRRAHFRVASKGTGYSDE